MAKAEITDEQIETIKLTYAQTGKYRAAARAAHCSVFSAKKYADNRDEYEHLRTEKKIDIIAKMADVQIKLLDAIVDPATIAKASLQERATAFGIVTDKRQLMSGEATERHEHRTADEDREQFARRLDELAERRRARAGDAGVRTG